MATIDLGRIRLNFRGTWNSANAYADRDVVYHRGTSYRVTADIAANTNTEPAASASMEVLSLGQQNRGDYDNATTYNRGDIVQDSNAQFQYINDTPAAGNATTVTTRWLEISPAPAANQLANPGGISVRNAANSTVELRPFTDANLETFEQRISYRKADEPHRAGRLDNEPGRTTTPSRGSVHNGVTVSIVGTGADRRFEWTDRDDNTRTGDGVAGGTNATLTVVRGRTYTIELPTAETRTFAVKSEVGTSDANKIATTGRLTNGGGASPLAVDVTASQAEPFYIEITPGENWDNDYVLVSEGSGSPAAADPYQLNFTVVEETSEIVLNDIKDMAFQRFMGDYNTYTESLKPLPSNARGAKRWGRGQIGEKSQIGTLGSRSQGTYMNRAGEVWGWGDNLVASTFGWLGFGGISVNGGPAGQKTQFRMPAWWFQQVKDGSGTGDYAKFLRHIDGTLLKPTQDATPVSGMRRIFDVPKVHRYVCDHGQGYFLLENGMAFVTGNAASGSRGNGRTAGNLYAAHLVSFKDDAGNDLTGTNYPKIKQITSSSTTAGGGPASTSYFAVDVEGNIYSWGENTNGELGRGDTTDKTDARRLDMSTFGTRRCLCIFTFGYIEGTTFAIMDDGSLWGTGDNATGCLGLGNITDQNTFQHIGNSGRDTTGSGAGNELAGRMVLHVMGASGDSDALRKIWLLLDNGQVFFAGDRVSNGAYSGSFHTSSADATRFVRIDDSANTINSQVNSTGNNQEVISMWTSGNSVPVSHLITDGGSVPLQRKVYAFGQNKKGSMGTDDSTTIGNSASTIGNWAIAEIEFTTGGNSYRDNADSDLAGDTVAGTQWNNTLEAALETAPICCIKYGGGRTTQSWLSTWMLDENGQTYFAGDASFTNPAPFWNSDDALDFAGTTTFTKQFVPCWTQPEEFVDIAMWNTSYAAPAASGVSQMTFAGAGRSGRVYGLGDNTKGCLGTGFKNALTGAAEDLCQADEFNFAWVPLNLTQHIS